MGFFRQLLRVVDSFPVQALFDLFGLLLVFLVGVGKNTNPLWLWVTVSVPSTQCPGYAQSETCFSGSEGECGTPGQLDKAPPR